MDLGVRHRVGLGGFQQAGQQCLGVRGGDLPAVAPAGDGQAQALGEGFTRWGRSGEAELHHAGDAQVLDQAQRGAGGEQPAMVQDRQPVAQGLGLVHIVGGEDHRAPFALDPPHHVPQAAPGLGVQPGGGLVQEHQLRIVHQGQGQGQPLLLAAGQGGVIGVGLVLELDQLQQFGGAAVPGVVAAVESERLPGGDLVEQAGALQLHPDPRADLPAVVAPVQPQQPDLARVRLREPLQDLQGGGLAGAVGAQQAEHLAAPHLQVQVLHRHHLGIGLAQAAHFQGQLGRFSGPGGHGPTFQQRQSGWAWTRPARARSRAAGSG